MKRTLIAGLLGTWLGISGAAPAQVPGYPTPGDPAQGRDPGRPVTPTSLPPASAGALPPQADALMTGVPQTAGDVPANGDIFGSAPQQRGVLAGNPFDAAEHVLPQDGPFRIYGWLDAGGVYNANNPASRFNGPYNAIDRDDFSFNQAYLIFEKPLGKGDGVDSGFRLDLLYGSDYFLAQSLGLEQRPDESKKWNSSQYYGLAVPQAFAEVGNQDYSLKVGHFYSLVGYEGVASAGNFFYSHSYSYQFAGPFTQWGTLGTMKRGNWTFDAGVVNGWNALDRLSDQPNFMGRVKWVGDERILGASFAVITGNENTLTTPAANRNRTRYSFIVDVNPTSDFEYVFHHWLGLQDDGTFAPAGSMAVPRPSTGPSTGGTALWYGIDQYLYYRLTDRLKVGARLEWFRDEDGTRVGLNLPANPNKRPFAGNFYSATLGLNYTPFRNLVIRPEVRYDAQGEGFPAFDDGRKKNQFTSAIDVILAF